MELGPPFALIAKAGGLLQPYKVAEWDSIPDRAKGTDGYWYGTYNGVLVFEVNRDLVEQPPADWPDLASPVFKNSVALSGDPRTSFTAMQAVYAAGLSLTKGDPGRASDVGCLTSPN